MSDIQFEIIDGIGRIVLSRPQALNALTLDMMYQMADVLGDWATNDDVQTVEITGGGKAFCAGGDIKATALGGDDLKADFMRVEYTNNYRIANFPKPFTAVLDGIVMGGGVGISWHGSHRIVTENTVFAMPETAIGFFPDVGVAYYLTKAPGKTGLYLALTGARLGPADCLYIGFGTDYQSATESEMPPGGLEEKQDVIDRHFSQGTVEDIIASLQTDESDWARETFETLSKMCPFSLKVTFEHFKRSTGKTLEDVLIMDYALSQRMMQRNDFYEGVRAMLIDKERAPKWQPERLEDISQDMVEDIFAPLGEADLVL